MRTPFVRVCFAFAPRLLCVYIWQCVHMPSHARVQCRQYTMQYGPATKVYRLLEDSELGLFLCRKNLRLKCRAKVYIPCFALPKLLGGAKNNRDNSAKLACSKRCAGFPSCRADVIALTRIASPHARNSRMRFQQMRLGFIYSTFRFVWASFASRLHHVCLAGEIQTLYTL